MADGAGGHGTAVRRRSLRADDIEGELLARFTAHPVFTEIERLPQETFLDVLLQRRFLSLLFAVVYDVGIDGLTDRTALVLVREILREEYPDPSGNTPSHREDLVHDLLALGATRQQVLTCRPSAVTAAVVEGTLALVADAGARGSDLELMTILRFWGEVLVAVEYGEFWRRMRAGFDAARTPSRFYRPHHDHDGRDPLATAAESALTHSGRLGACLVRMLADEGAEERFAETERRVLELRLEFYDQFPAPGSDL
jgi:hypothetical protein